MRKVSAVMCQKGAQLTFVTLDAVTSLYLLINASGTFRISSTGTKSAALNSEYKIPITDLRNNKHNPAKQAAS
jgi:hypothetical protein